MNLRILRGLAGAGVELAYPSRVLYLPDDPRRGLSVRVQPENGLDGGSDGDAVGADPHGNNGARGAHG